MHPNRLGLRLLGVKRFWRNNGLSIVMLGMFFLIFIFGQVWSGWLEDNEDRTEHGLRAHRLAEYLTSAHFVEATMENWESEFLQMGIFVFATVFLYQKCSAE
jgi:predicted negative regulator of RcsB-dependent stress response